MSVPQNICPLCYAPFTYGIPEIGQADEMAKHYWWHKLERLCDSPPNTKSIKEGEK